MSRLRKEDYMSDEAFELKSQLNARIREDRERALAQKIVDKIPQERKQYVLDILSRELVAKGNGNVK